MKFLAQLQNPPREFTAIPFWFLNGELTAEELRRQLADFAAHGIYGVVLHPRMGLSPDITYLGERYFAHIRTAVEAAAALDMKIVLYDEGMYPSGSASGLVVACQRGHHADPNRFAGGRAAGAGGKRRAGRAQKRRHDARAALGRG